MTTSETRVVNLHRELYDVYIGRAGHGFDGYYGNPVVPDKPCPICKSTHAKAGGTLRCYKIYFDKRVSEDLTFRRRVLELRGKVLGCFCSPNPCHGMIIKQWLDEQS